jgi:hypothetical protein
MKKTTIFLAIVCSIFVGASMAVTYRMLAGGTPSGSQAKGGAAGGHNMPPGMSHEEHLKQMAAQNAEQQPSSGASASAPAGTDHNMPAGMSHEEHQKMMAEAAAKQQGTGQGASTASPQMDHSNMPAGMDHNMPAGMSHEQHQKMMADAAAKQQGTGQGGSTASPPMDHSNMPAGMEHNMPPGMNHEQHMKMMAAEAAKQKAAAAEAQSHSHHPGQDDSPDPRPEFRAIKSLTADEVKAYEEGTGHGMAKAAEQNHYPGPRHILDLAKELQLSDDQIRQIEAIKSEMSGAAVPTGKQLIENERKLNLLFAQKKIDQTQLAALVAESASIQGKLRLIHLSAHLKAYKNAKNSNSDSHHDQSM